MAKIYLTPLPFKIFFEGYNIDKTDRPLENKNKSEMSSNGNRFLWELRRWYKLCKNKMKQSKYLPEAIIYNMKLFYSHFFPSIRMFLIEAVLHIGSNKTERAAYGITEVKFAVCNVMTDRRENDVNLLQTQQSILAILLKFLSKNI